MNYSGILKKAYHITIKNKILWLLGMMVGGGASCNFGSGADFGQDDFESNFDFSSILDYWYILALIGVLVLFLILIFIVLSVISRGGLLYGVNKAGENQRVSFKESFKYGVSKFWRVLGLQLLFGLIIFLGAILLAVGVALFVIVGSVSHFLILKILLIILGIFFTLLGFAAIIFLALLIALISNYIFCYAVLENKKIKEAIKLGWNLFRKHIGETIILSLILMGIGLGVSLMMLIIIVPLAFILLAIGYGFYLAFSWMGAVIIAALAIIILLVITLFIKGILNVFVFSTWVNAWHELIDKK